MVSVRDCLQSGKTIYTKHSTQPKVTRCNDLKLNRPCNTGRRGTKAGRKLFRLILSVVSHHRDTTYETGTRTILQTGRGVNRSNLPRIECVSHKIIPGKFLWICCISSRSVTYGCANRGVVGQLRRQNTYQCTCSQWIRDGTHPSNGDNRKWCGRYT